MAFHLELTRVYSLTFLGPLPAIHLRVGAEIKVVTAYSKLIYHIYRDMLPTVRHVCQVRIM